MSDKAIQKRNKLPYDWRKKQQERVEREKARREARRNKAKQQEGEETECAN